MLLFAVCCCLGKCRGLCVDLSLFTVAQIATVPAVNNTLPELHGYRA